MRTRFGLQARFLTLVVASVLVAALALGALLQRQWTMRDEILALSRESIQNLVVDRLQEQARAVGANTAQALVNPLYTFDLEMIGRIVGDVLAQPDVKYVTVFAPNGAVIHDGTDAIASYGQVMSDPLGPTVITAKELSIHRSGNMLDVTVPILIGEERLGGVRIGYTLESSNAMRPRLRIVERDWARSASAICSASSACSALPLRWVSASVSSCNACWSGQSGVSPLRRGKSRRETCRLPCLGTATATRSVNWCSLSNA